LQIAVKTNSHQTALIDEYDLIRSVSKDSFFSFVLEFWDTIITERFVYNWHIPYICNELQMIAERVFAGKPKEYDLIINVPPGSSKPVWEQMPILMADGSYKKLKNIVKGNMVIGKSGNPCKVLKVHKQGKLPCIRITTFGGRKIILALDHPILTTYGWKEAGKIIPNDHLALMHTPKIKATTNRGIDEFRLAGYLIGDGSVSGKNCSITNITPEYIEDVCSCIERLGFAYSIAITKQHITLIRLKSKYPECSNKGKYKGMGRGYREPTGPRKWMLSDDVQLAGKNSKTKKIPPFVWRGTDEQIKAFLAAYFHCDGCVSWKHKGKKNIVVEFATISIHLAYGLQRLFLRLGIAMNVRKRIAKNGFAYNRGLKNYEYYVVFTSDQDTVSRFAQEIPLLGYKREKFVDFGKPICRTFQQVYWPDCVKIVEPIKELPCRCLTVDKDESFVVNGVVVHNSSLASVFFPAWIWMKMPTAKFIGTSYGANLAEDLSRKSRDVIQGDLYKACWPDIIIREDQNAKSYFLNTKGGFRIAVGTGGITGYHGHFIVVDDPINPKEAASEADLLRANIWMNETLSTRKVDKSITPTILIMQRLHQNDPTANMLENSIEGKIKHICLPAEVSPEIKPVECVKFYRDGLLDTQRLSKDVLEEYEKRLGQYGYAGQMQQQPVPPGGGMFKIDRILVDTPPDVDDERKWIKIVRYWDKAASPGKGMYTVGVKLGQDLKKRFWLLDVRRGQWESSKREEIIKNTAIADGRHVLVAIEQEPGSGGKESAESTVRNLAGWKVIVDIPVGDKTTRADTFSVQVNNGSVRMVPAGWNLEYLDEMKYFPMSKYKDQIDASSGAFAQLTKTKKIVGSLGVNSRGRG